MKIHQERRLRAFNGHSTPVERSPLEGDAPGPHVIEHVNCAKSLRGSPQAGGRHCIMKMGTGMLLDGPHTLCCVPLWSITAT